MKVSNIEAIQKSEKIEKAIKNAELPAKAMYAIISNKKKLKEILENFEETRKTLIDKYSEKDENGEPKIENDRYKILDTNTFNGEYSELLQAENDVEFYTIKIDTLGDSVISSDLMEAISDFIVD